MLSMGKNNYLNIFDEGNFKYVSEFIFVLVTK